MAGLFQPKRVQVPGLLSDEGLAVALKNLSDTTKQGAKAAPPNTAAVDAANQITAEALKPSPTVKTAAPRVPGVELSAGASAVSDTAPPRIGFGGTVTDFDVGKAIVQAGTLTPDQGAADRAERAAQAGAEAEVATGELAAKTDLLSADEREAIGLPPLTPEDTMRLSSSIALEQQIVKEKGERAKFIAEGPAATQTEWLNLAQVGTRSAIQMGVGALRYPADIWDTLAAIEKGTDEVKKSEVSVYLDNVDKALTAMMPGDKTRSKDFTTKLASGFGSMVGFMITGWAGRAVGLPAWLTTGTLGAAVEGDSLYQEADTFGATATQKAIALFAGSGLGLTEAIPIDRAFMRADVASGGMIRQLLANSTSTSLEEFIQEASQSLGEDIIAKYGVGFGTGYDPAREISVNNALENGLIGAITGGVVGGATTLLSGGKEINHVEMDEAQQEAVVDEVLDAETKRFNDIVGDELDGEGEAAPPAPGASAEAPAGSKAAAARPDPVRGDAVQQIVEQAKAGKNDPTITGLTRELSALDKRGDVFDLADGELLTYPGSVPTTVQRVPQRTGRRAELLVDSRYAEVEVLDEGQQYLERRAPKLRADSGLSAEIPAKAKEGVMYRGMSAPEYREFLRTGQLVSTGTYNMEGQEGLTYWTTSPEAAVSYSSSFAPAQFKASFERPAYVVAARRTGVEDEHAVAGVAEHEVGVGRAVARDEVLDVYEGVVYAQTPNNYSIREGYDGSPQVGGSNQGNTYIGWRKLDAPEAALPAVEAQVAEPASSPYEAIQLEPTETLPLPNIEAGLTGPIPIAVKAARAYAAAAGLPLRRQREYVKVDTARATRIAQAYADMKHEPADPAVLAAYTAMAEETVAQYQFVKATGIVVEPIPKGGENPYNSPREVLADIANGHIWYFRTEDGFGSNEEFDPSQSPLLEATSEKDAAGNTMLVNDVFRVVHDFFGHGMEGSGFGPRGEENAWQSHMRLFSASAVPAMTSETRGQNSWVNYGPFGAANRANPKETVYADQKTGIMPSWTWQEGIEDSQAYVVSAPIELTEIANADSGVPRAVRYKGQVFTGATHYAAVDAVIKAQGTLDAEASAALTRRLDDALADDLGYLVDGQFIPLEKANPATRFRDALQAAIAESKYGAVVKVYSPAKYAKMRLFLAPDGNSGFALDGENIVSVFGRGGGKLRKIIDAAVANGGRTLDAFDTGLPKMYASLGFRETGRTKWNDKYAPKDWPYDELGRPDVVDMEYVGNEIEQQSAVPLRRKTETLKPFGLDASARSVTVRQVAAALELRQQAQAGKIDRKDYSDKARNRLAKWMAEEVAFEMAHPEQSGVGWYSERFQAALNTFSDIYPELVDSQDARDMLTLFIAITSDGQKVLPNFAQAIDIYGNYRRSGNLSTGRGHARQSSIYSNMAHIQKLLETHKTPAALREYLLKEDTVANLRKDAKASDSEFRTAYKADVKLPRAAVELGPKLGAFYANLMGAQGYLTMDRWWSRTFNRYRGDLIDAPTAAGLERVRGLLGQPEMTDEETIAATVPYRHSYEAKGFKNGTEIEKAANTVYKAAFEGLNDQPFSASDRSFMIDTVTQAQKVLKKQGIEMSIADIQAVLWYYEKRLYGELGARQSADISYEEAAARVVADRVAADAEQREAIAYDARLSNYEPSALMTEEDYQVDFMTGTATVRQPYIAEPTRPTKGIPTPTPPGPNQEDVRLSAISRNFVKVLDLTARHGRLAAKDSTVMGEYNRRTAAIRLRTWTDFSTLVHEGGHALNDSMAAPMNAFVQANITEINKIAHTMYAGDLSKAAGETVRREGFAEFFRAYVTNPAFARNRWPQLVDAFETTLRTTDPKVLDGLNSISTQFAAWVQLPSRQLIRNMVVDGRREQGIDAAVKELKDQGFKTWMHEHARRATAAMINKYVSVAELEAQLLNLGEANRGAPIDLQRSESPTAILRLARNAGSRAQVQITDGVIGYRSTQSVSRGLREALMTALGIPPDTTPGSLDQELMRDFDAYLVARRAFDEYRRFDLGEIERPPIGAQKGDVVRAIKEYEQSQPQFIPAAKIVHDYGMAMWQKRFDAGLMDKETYEEGLQRQFYAPLQRDVSDKQGTGADSIGFSSSVLTKGPRFRGSDRDIISPMTVLMHMTFALEKQIAENDAKRALAILADRAGQAGALVERIPASQLIGQSFSVQQVAQRLTADAGLSAADASDLMTILGGSVDKGDVMTLFRSEQAGTQGENVLFFWENGKIAAIRLNDSSLASDVVNTMNAVGRENMDILLEGVAATSTVFRTAITSWPDFLVINYIRDQFSAWILGGTNYVPFATGFQGISDEIRQKQWAKSYNAAGGILGGMNVAALHTARVDRDIGALRAKGYVANVFGDMNGGWSNIPGAVKGFARLTALTETGTRLGLYRSAYERAIKDGLSEYDASVEAAYIATDYIDFGLNGSKMLHARRLVPFLSAQLQGLYKMVRTLGGDEVARRKGLAFALGAYFKNINNLPLSRLEQQQLRTGRSAWLKMLSLGLIGAALWAIFRDDPDYQEAGEYLRTTGWVIPTGDGKIFYIPKPFELALISNAVERGLEFATGDTTAIDRFKRGVAFALTPPTAPPAIQSVVEVAANYDFFTGREVVPAHIQALAPQLQYDNYTSSIAKWLGGATGQSPLVVDHILSGMGASAYRDISTMLNAADPSRPMPDETEWPILRRFVRDVRRGSASAQDFWAQASNTSGKLERGKATYKQYMEMGNEPAANRFLSTLSADERAYAVLMTDFKPEEKRLSPFYRARQVTSIVSGMRRENASELGLGDTTREALPGEGPLTFQLSRALRTQVDDILSEIARREVRNTLIATGQPGWTDKEVLPLEPTLDMLLAISPDTYDEFQRRRVKAKVYDAEAVYDYWPEVRDRLVSDGPDAVLSDAVAVAGVVF